MVLCEGTVCMCGGAVCRKQKRNHIIVLSNAVLSSNPEGADCRVRELELKVEEEEARRAVTEKNVAAMAEEHKGREVGLT